MSKLKWKVETGPLKSKKHFQLRNFTSQIGFMRVFGLLVFGAGSWYLFTSGEAITSAKGDNVNTHFSKKLRDSATIKLVKIKKDTAIFSPLEKFEAQSADSFFNAMVSNSHFNGSALIAHNGKVLYSHQFGYSDYATREMLTDTSEFQLGSVSKQFTAVSIMMLKEKGLLSYDDSIVKYFPDFPYKGVTIRMCLDHRSGIPNYMFTCCAECTNQSSMIDNGDVMEMLAKYKPECYFKPDHLFNYCNTNYCVLAAVVEKITGKSFSDFVRKNIFEPCHMTHTFIYDKYDTVVPNRVTGYNQSYHKAGFDFLDGVAGDKGIYSTVTDLLKWDQALYSDKLVSQATLKEAYTPHTRWMGNRSYGFGWHLMLFDNDTIVYHGGWWHGFNCDFIRDIKQKNTIIVLSNHVNWCIRNNWSLLALFRRTPLATMPVEGKEGDNAGM
jgi:CubicO group peptidase (beta-lactamase class C family)